MVTRGESAMDRKTLKFLRLVMPGLIAMLLLLPVKDQLSLFYESELPFELGLLEVPLFAFVVGAIYYVLGLRGQFNFQFHQKVKSNIKDRLWTAARTTSAPSEWDDKKARDIFYRLIDNDNTLTARSEIIYFNGLIWTSIADARALGTILSAVAVGMLLIDSSSVNALVLLVVNVAAVVVSFPLSYLVTKHHIKLGDEQLDYIGSQLKGDLDTYISNYGL